MKRQAKMQERRIHKRKKHTDRQTETDYPCCVEHEISKTLTVAALARLLKGYCDILPF